MKSMYLPILIGVCILCQSLDAVALNIRTLALGGENLIPERYVKVEEGYQRLAFSSMQPSALIKAAFAGEAMLPLYGLVTPPDGKVTYQIVEKIKFPAGAKGVLLLGWGDAKGARYLAIDDDYLSAKYNDWLLINAASKPIAFQLGRQQKPVLIQSNGIVNHKIKVPDGVGLDVVGQAKWGEKVKTFYSTYWPIRAGERGIVIFYESGERIALKRITDVLFKPVALKPGEPSSITVPR